MWDLGYKSSMDYRASRRAQNQSQDGRRDLDRDLDARRDLDHTARHDTDARRHKKYIIRLIRFIQLLL